MSTPAAFGPAPSGGGHILFRTGRHRIPKSTATLGKRPGKEASGLDVVGLGAMTVLPGSERPDGVVEWEPGLSPDNIEISVVPDWLVDLMLKAAGEYHTQRDREARRPAFIWGINANGTNATSVRAEKWLCAAFEGMAEEISAAPNGAQEKTLNGQAWHLGTKIAALRDRGFSIPAQLAEEGRQALIQAGPSMVNHDPSWPWRRYEIEEKVDDALAAGLERPIATLPPDLWPNGPGAVARSHAGAAQPEMSMDPPEPGSFEPEEDTNSGGGTPKAERSKNGSSAELEDEPEPLLPDLERATSFPLDALGTPVRDATKALVQLTQAPDAVAGQTVLAGLNVVAQRHVDVIVPQGGDNPGVGPTQPISCFFLTVATTGERKSSCERIALKVHRIYEREAGPKYKEELEAFKRKKAVWEAQKKAHPQRS